MSNDASCRSHEVVSRFRGKVWRYRLPVFVGLSLGGAALADYLFYEQWVGWTLGAFLALVLGVVLFRHGRGILMGRSMRLGWVVTLAVVGLAGAMVLEPGVLAFVLAMLGVSSLVMIGRGGWPRGGLGWRWLGRATGLWGRSVILPILDSRLVRRWQARAEGMASGKYGTALRLVWLLAGLFIPLALTLVFVGLFALANPVVSQWLGQFGEKFADISINVFDYLTFSRLFLWYMVGFGIYGLLRYRRRTATRRTARAVPSFVIHEAAASPVPADTAVQRFAQHKREGTNDPAIKTAAAQRQHQPGKAPAATDVAAWLATKFTTVIVRSLILMNIVFAVQIVLDGRYLVLGSELPEGMSYAEYAHRGAYPLLVTALLAAGLVLAVFRPGGVAERSRLARTLVLVWIGQNVVLLITALWRLGMYVEVYSLTRLRVAASVWMLLVAGCLLLVFWRIGRGRDNAWLTGRAMGMGLVVLYLCCFVPFDPMIASFNVDRCKELGGSAGPIDVAYLETLGPDALPAIDRLIAELPAPVAAAPSAFEPDPNLFDDIKADSRQRVAREQGPRKIDQHYDPTQQSLRAQLVQTRDRLDLTLEQQLDNWRGWTARRAWLRSVSAAGPAVVAQND